MASFPFRVAAVDVGSNAIRLAAVEFADPSRREELEYERAPIRLGQSAFAEGELTAAIVQATVDALTRFRGRLDDLGVTTYRAVATSAVRESRNGDALVDRVRREAGLRLEAISGREEARLVWRAVRDRFPLDGRWLIVDLGGGSLEVTVADASGLEGTESHPIGTVRMLQGAKEEAGGMEALKRELDRRLERYVDALGAERPDGAGLRGLVATGGNIEALAELAGAARDERGVSRLPLGRLAETVERLRGMTTGERIERLDLRPDRADVIVPAGSIYQGVAERVGAEEIVVPNVGVIDGVLLDLLDDAAEGNTTLNDGGA